jgi:hypothetical protein
MRRFLCLCLIFVTLAAARRIPRREEFDIDEFEANGSIAQVIFVATCDVALQDISKLWPGSSVCKCKLGLCRSDLL